MSRRAFVIVSFAGFDPSLSSKCGLHICRLFAPHMPMDRIRDVHMFFNRALNSLMYLQITQFEKLWSTSRGVSVGTTIFTCWLSAASFGLIVFPPRSTTPTIRKGTDIPRNILFSAFLALVLYFFFFFLGMFFNQAADVLLPGDSWQERWCKYSFSQSWTTHTSMTVRINPRWKFNSLAVEFLPKYTVAKRSAWSSFISHGD